MRVHRCSDCESMSASIEQEVGRVSHCRESHLKALQHIETEVRETFREG